MGDTVPFTEEAVKAYLDGAIRRWRKLRDQSYNPAAVYYIDAFQSVRSSLFDELLADDDPEEK